MNRFNTIFLIVFLAVVQGFNSAKAALQVAEFENAASKPVQVFLRKQRLQKNKILNFFYDANDLVLGTKFPISIKAEIYIFDEDGNKKLLKVLTKTIKSDKSSKNVILKTQVDLLRNGDKVFVDLFDSNNSFYGTYSYDVSFEGEASDVIAPDLESVAGLECETTDPECLLKFFLQNVNFVASYDNKLITEVSRESSGSYNVILPIKKGRKLKKE